MGDQTRVRPSSFSFLGELVSTKVLVKVLTALKMLIVLTMGGWGGQKILKRLTKYLKYVDKRLIFDKRFSNLTKDF